MLWRRKKEGGKKEKEKEIQVKNTRLCCKAFNNRFFGVLRIGLFVYVSLCLLLFTNKGHFPFENSINKRKL